MAALLRSALRRAAAPAFRFSGHPAATCGATRRAMHTGGWHRFYASPGGFSGGGEWERIDNYFAAFALTVALAYRHYVSEQADKRWEREQNRRDQQERMWGMLQTGIPSRAKGSGVHIEATTCKLL